MANAARTAISPTRSENYAEWYQQVIKAADLAEISPSRGCMTIKPWGYAIWENIQSLLDQKLKATGHQNLYFPLLIPLRFIQQETEHIEGFAKECAVVTHTRLQKNSAGQLVPASPLDEPYIIRPTSETIIGEAFARWIQSYRDLPLLVNQWANIVRWEMRTRLFLRTTEFLWQEGHTAHSTAETAREETQQILALYADCLEHDLAIPVIRGEKTASERFPGAVNTYCLEAMMQDKKALQAATSHFLGQHFSRAYHITFLDAAGQRQHVWTTSWGISTRLIGGLIMTHSDDNGLILPPKIAPYHIVIIPILRQQPTDEAIRTYCQALASKLQQCIYDNRPLRVKIDWRDSSGGEKGWDWIKKGVPLLIDIGTKEVTANTISLKYRDHHDLLHRTIFSQETFLHQVVHELAAMQQRLLQQALAFMQASTIDIQHKEDFYDFFAKEGGFAQVYWQGTPEIEAKLKQSLNVSIRCIPMHIDSVAPHGTCLFTGAPNAQQVIFAKAY